MCRVPTAAAPALAGADEPAAAEPAGRRHHPVAAAAPAAGHRAGRRGRRAQPPLQPQQVQPGLQPGQRSRRASRSRANPAGGVAPAEPAAPQTDEVVVEPPPQRIANPTAVFAGLDKITGRITTFDVAINETVQFGALQVTPRVCYSRPPTETPQTDAFVEVDEVTLQGTIKRIFTGWMFAASPGLHAVEHPIYDVWLTDCKGGKNPAVAEVPDDQQQPAAKPQPRSRRRGSPSASHRASCRRCASSSACPGARRSGFAR